MCSLLLNLRCSPVNDFKDNFHSLYGKQPPCKMLCGEDVDSQRHALSCKSSLKKRTPSEIDQINLVQCYDIFGSMEEQYQMAYKRILKVRKGLPGLNNSGPD